MSTREIIAALPRLTLAELHAVEHRIAVLTSRQTIGADTRLRAERVVRQAEVEAILDKFP